MVFYTNLKQIILSFSASTANWNNVLSPDDTHIYMASADLSFPFPSIRLLAPFLNRTIVVAELSGNVCRYETRWETF